MKRYKIQTNYNLNCTATMVESDGGEWIRYTDYLKEQSEIKERRLELLKILQQQLVDAENERIYE